MIGLNTFGKFTINIAIFIIVHCTVEVDNSVLNFDLMLGPFIFVTTINGKFPFLI